MLRLRVAFLLVCLAGAGGLAAAQSKGPNEFARLDRIDVEPYLADLTRVRAYVNLVTLQGSLITGVKPDELLLSVGGNKLKATAGIGRFVDGNDTMDLAIVIELHSTYRDALEDLEDPVAHLIARLPKETTRVAIVSYSDTVKAGLLQEPAAAERRWRRLAADDMPEKRELVTAMQRAIKILANATPLRPGPTRRVILVISDGNNLDIAWDTGMEDFNAVVKAANNAGIVIHSIAYSVADDRPPMRNLGQLSKKTFGTFRWAVTRDAFNTDILSVNEELRQQMVLTFLIPRSTEISPGTSVAVVCKSALCGAEGALESNPRRAPKMACGGEACDPSHACIANACVTNNMHGAHGATAAIVAVLIGLGALGGMAFVYVKKIKPKTEGKPAKGGRPGVAAAAGQPQVPGAPNPAYPHAPQVPVQPQIVLPDFSNMPYVGGSEAAKQMAQQVANIPYVGAHVAAQQAAAAAAQRPAGPPVAAQTRVPSIMVLSGPHQGKMFPLRHGFTVGKVRGCDLVLEDGYTSNHHAQFHIDLGGGCTVVDLGSTNGIYVNGVRTQSHRLAHGMAVRVGATEIRFLQG